MNYITGRKFESLANGKNIFYVKIDHVDTFFKTQRPQHPYVLITHNGDYGVTDRQLANLNDPNLIRWYGQNIEYQHPKLESIPIGIANPEWGHGREEFFNQVRADKEIKKERMFYCNFAMHPHIADRHVCKKMIEAYGLEYAKRDSIREYLVEIKKSFFCPAPNGNGVDTHKLWECLYMGTIPIVTHSINADAYKDMPVYFLDKWEDFDASVFTEELFNKLWFESYKLDFDFWKHKIISSACQTN